MCIHVCLYKQSWQSQWRKFPKKTKGEAYRKWLWSTHLNLLSFNFSIEISTFSSLFYWNLYISLLFFWNLDILFTLLLKSLLSLYFSIEILTSLYSSFEISTFSLLFYWNLYFLFTFLLKSLLLFTFLLKSLLSLYFPFCISTFLLKSLLSLYFSIEISTFSLPFFLKSRHSLDSSIQISTFSLLFYWNLYISLRFYWNLYFLFTVLPLASKKTFFWLFFASKFCLPDGFFDFQVFYSRSHFWKPKKQASGSQNFRLLEVKKLASGMYVFIHSYRFIMYILWHHDLHLPATLFGPLSMSGLIVASFWLNEPSLAWLVKFAL